MSEKIDISLPYWNDLYERLEEATKGNLELQKVLLEMFRLIFEADIGDYE